MSICYQVYDVPCIWYRKPWSLSLSKVANIFTVRVPVKVTIKVTVGVMFIGSRKVSFMVSVQVIGNTTVKINVECPIFHNLTLTRKHILYLQQSDHSISLLLYFNRYLQNLKSQGPEILRECMPSHLSTPRPNATYRKKKLMFLMYILF